jgi:hypothetical protein
MSKTLESCCCLMRCYLGCHKDQFWRHCFSVFSLMTCLVWSDCVVVSLLMMIPAFSWTDVPSLHFLKLQSDINSVCGWCSSDIRQLSTNQTRVISFSKLNWLAQFWVQIVWIMCYDSESIIFLVVFIDSRLHFHYYFDYIFSQAVRLLDSIWTNVFFFISG